MAGLVALVDYSEIAKHVENASEILVAAERLTSSLARAFERAAGAKKLFFFKVASVSALKLLAEAGCVVGINPGISGFLALVRGKSGIRVLLLAGGFSPRFLLLDARAWPGGEGALQEFAAKVRETATVVGPPEIKLALNCGTAAREGPGQGARAVLALAEHMLSVELSGDREGIIKRLSGGLRRYGERARALGIPSEEYLRRLVAGLCGGADAVSATLTEFCKRNPDSWVAGLPCVAVAAVKAAVRRHREFESGIDFYTKVLKLAAGAAYVVGKAQTAEFIRGELVRLRNEEYRDYVMHRIGSFTLPLVLALPDRCRITALETGRRKISCRQP